MDSRATRTALLAATGWLVLAMLVLPLWSFGGSSLLENTASHLGAQGSSHAWAMNLTLLMAGAAAQLAGWRKLRDHPLPLFLLGVFAISLALTGLYRHAPLVEGGDAALAGGGGLAGPDGTPPADHVRDGVRLAGLGGTRGLRAGREPTLTPASRGP